MASQIVASLGRAALNLLWAGGILLAAAGLGARLLRLLRLEIGNVALHWALASGSGLGVLAYITLGVGLLGWLRAPLPAIFVLLGCLAGWELTIEALRFGGKVIAVTWRMVCNGPWAGRFLLMVVLVLITIGLIGALGPAVGSDSLTVHLALPKSYLRAGRIIYVRSNFTAAYPACVDMLLV